jgi:hypothetical protein
MDWTAPTAPAPSTYDLKLDAVLRHGLGEEGGADGGFLRKEKREGERLRGEEVRAARAGLFFRVTPRRQSG